MKKIVVKIELHSDDEKIPPKLLETFNIIRDINNSNKHNCTNYLVEHGNKTFNIKNFPSWLNILHLTKSALIQLIPNIVNNKVVKHSYLKLPNNWEISNRRYEVICPHGIGHYTGIDVPHACDGCCSKIQGLYPKLE